eukprot:14300357-Alexandrium_andersonii.AAC.1
MSASLVGSEMCIRDSRLPLRTSRRARTRSMGQRSTPCSPPFGACATSTVSYTHLTLPTICSV